MFAAGLSFFLKDAIVAIIILIRQESVSFLGVPISKYIAIDNAEVAFRSIRLTPADKSIDLVLYTPGGLVLAVFPIAHALKTIRAESRRLLPIMR
jgi:ClpP class serine protease